jgi:hypothetical protein
MISVLGLRFVDVTNTNIRRTVWHMQLTNRILRMKQMIFSDLGLC